MDRNRQPLNNHTIMRTLRQMMIDGRINWANPQRIETIVECLRECGVGEGPVGVGQTHGYLRTSVIDMKSRISSIKQSFQRYLGEIFEEHDQEGLVVVAQNAAANAAATAYERGVAAGRIEAEAAAAANAAVVGEDVLTVERVNEWFATAPPEDVLSTFVHAVGAGKCILVFYYFCTIVSLTTLHLPNKNDSPAYNSIATKFICFSH